MPSGRGRRWAAAVRRRWFFGERCRVLQRDVLLYERNGLVVQQGDGDVLCLRYRRLRGANGELQRPAISRHYSKNRSLSFRTPWRSSNWAAAAPRRKRRRVSDSYRCPERAGQAQGLRAGSAQRHHPHHPAMLTRSTEVTDSVTLTGLVTELKPSLG